jgi:peptide deformylase
VEGVQFTQTFINPKITKEYGEEVELIEGCLSIPTVQGAVKRKSKINIEFYDQDWKFHKETFDGLKARVIQHEYDHLKGILFIDHLSNIWKTMLEVPLEMVKTKQIETPYLQR